VVNHSRIHNEADLATSDNVEEVLLREQENLLLWQESSCNDAFTERQAVLDLIFSLWKQYDIDNPSIIESMTDILLPDCAYFEAFTSPEARLSAIACQGELIDFHIRNYRQLIQEQAGNAYESDGTLSKWG
jgi:hypothetical protein